MDFLAQLIFLPITTLDSGLPIDAFTFAVQGAGCPCHEQERLAGRPAACPMQSRRLPEVLGRLEQFTQFCADAIHKPGLDVQLGELPARLKHDRAGAFRLASAIATHKLDFLRRLPWSLARAHDPATMQACIDEFDASSTEKRHSVSAQFLEASSTMRRHCEALTAGESCPRQGLVTKLVHSPAVCALAMPSSAPLFRHALIVP